MHMNYNQDSYYQRMALTSWSCWNLIAHITPTDNLNVSFPPPPPPPRQNPKCSPISCSWNSSNNGELAAAIQSQLLMGVVIKCALRMRSIYWSQPLGFIHLYISHACDNSIIIFIRIVATATIKFSLARLRLLIEGSSCLRAAFINFGAILPSANHKIVTQKTGLWGLHFKIWSINKQPCCRRTKKRTSSALN